MKRIRICAAIAAALLAQQALAQNTASSTSSSSANPSSNAQSTGNVQSNTFGSTNNTNSSSSANQSASASSTNSQNNGSASTLNANFTIVNPSAAPAANSTQSSVPADGVLKQSVTGETYTYGEQRTYVEYGGTQTIKNVPSIAAPPLASSNDTCMGSASGGLAVAGFGITGAGTYVDEHCKRIKMSRELWNKGMKAASLAMDCMDRDAREALELTGFVCPQTARAQKQAEEAGLKQAQAIGAPKLQMVSVVAPARAPAAPAAVPAAPAAVPAAPAQAPAVAAEEWALPVVEPADVAVATPVRIAPEPERAVVPPVPQEPNVIIRRVDDGASRALR